MDQQTQTATTLPDTNFLSEVQNSLLGQSGIISSSTSDIESSINASIASLQSSTESSNAALQSEFERNSGYLLSEANDAMVNGRAAGSGGLLNMSALRVLTETTDKSLKDLAQRKEELVLQNNSLMAAKISDLELKALEYKQQAQQKIFDNLLGLGNFGLQVQQENRAQQAQNFQERSAIASIGLQYGVSVNENDTIESIVARAMPTASRIQQAELAKLSSEVAYNNAKLREIEAGTAKTYDPVYAAQALAKIQTNPALTEEERKTRMNAIYSNIGTNDLIKVYEEQDKMISEAYNPANLMPKYVSQLQSGLSSETIKQGINSATYLSPQQKKDALKTLEDARKASGTSNTGVFGSMSGFQKAGVNYAPSPMYQTYKSLTSSLFNFYNK